MKYIAGIIVLAILANLYLAWGTAAVFGWTVALAGWVPHIFNQPRAQHGNP